MIGELEVDEALVSIVSNVRFWVDSIKKPEKSCQKYRIAKSRSKRSESETTKHVCLEHVFMHAFHQMALQKIN